MKFKNFKNKEQAPFAVYGDFECILKKIDNDNSKMNEHIPCAVGYYFICTFDESLSYYRHHVGLDSPKWFVQELKTLAELVEEIHKNPKPMENLTVEQERKFLEAEYCHICELPFKLEDVRVRDHSHLTGQFRGAGHSECNILYQDWKTIAVIFHNLSGYDGHILINDLANCFEGEIRLIPQNKEKYISFTKFIKGSKISLRFIDSLRFLNAPLDKLVKNLSDLPILRKEFSNFTPHQHDLISKKDTFFTSISIVWKNSMKRNSHLVKNFIAL